MIFQNCLKFHRLTAREVTYNKFEISLVVFMPNITTNHAITYTIKIQDGDHVQCRRHSHPAAPHHPQNIPHISCREDQRLPTEGKIISKYCNTSKLKGRSSINTLPPPPTRPMYHCGDMILRVRRSKLNAAHTCTVQHYGKSHWASTSFIRKKKDHMQYILGAANITLEIQTANC